MKREKEIAYVPVTVDGAAGFIAGCAQSLVDMGWFRGGLVLGVYVTAEGAMRVAASWNALNPADSSVREAAANRLRWLADELEKGRGGDG